MKIRQGFVSNSSSSSFLLAVPEYVAKESTKSLIEDAFGLMEESPLRGIIDDFVADFLKMLGVPEEYWGWKFFAGALYSEEPSSALLQGVEIEIKEDSLYLRSMGGY